MNVALIDYGAGNVPSVERALRKLGAQSFRTNEACALAAADAIMLPGVGHYSKLMRALDDRQLRAPLIAAVHYGIPFLGICLGLQAIYRSSEEASDLDGLNLLAGRISSLPKSVKLPHMGWDQVQIVGPSRLLHGVAPDAFFYFAHTFAGCEPGEDAVAVCNYGARFAAVVEHKNIYATQFHPEKSGAAGAQILQNFLSIASRGLCKS